MPNEFNTSGAQSALSDAEAPGVMDKAAELAKDKIKDKGKSILNDKIGSKASKNDKGGDLTGSAKSGKSDVGGKDKGLLKNKGGEKSGAQKLKDLKNKAVMASKAASVGSKASFLSKMMSGAQMIASMMMNLVSSAVGGVAALFSAIGSAISAVGTFIANIGIGIVNGIAGGVAGVAGMLGGALSLGSTASTVLASILLIGGSGAGVAIVGTIGSTMLVNRADNGPIDCRETVDKTMKQVQIENNANMLSNAKHVYSVMKTFGLVDEQIAGMLGNMQAESSIDPTVIEGIYTEPFNINGPLHKKAIADLDLYTRTTLSSLYAARGTDYTQNKGYLADDGKKYPGLGMVQYTGNGARIFINFAKSVDKDWWDLDFQLAYALAKNAPTGWFGNNFWNVYKQQKGSASQMATWFAKYFEGNTALAGSARANNATAWFSQIKTWNADKSYGSSVIEMANKLGSVASTMAVSNAISKCVKVGVHDNNDLAKAAVSYSYKHQDEGINNDGTPLYRAVVNGVRENTPEIYRSCDRAVASAIRWTGTDITFPMGITNDQLAYMLTSPKWKRLGLSTELKMNDLQPGDVFCLIGHVFMYVGHEAIAAKYPDVPKKYDSISASFPKRSVGCGSDTYDMIMFNKGLDFDGRGAYTVFRCVKPDNSDKFKHVGSDIRKKRK